MAKESQIIIDTPQESHTNTQNYHTNEQQNLPQTGQSMTNDLNGALMFSGITLIMLIFAQICLKHKRGD